MIVLFSFRDACGGSDENALQQYWVVVTRKHLFEVHRREIYFFESKAKDLPRRLN